MEFALLTEVYQQTAKGSRRGHYLCLEIGFETAAVYQCPTIYRESQGGPDPREGKHLEWLATRVYVNLAGDARATFARELWFRWNNDVNTGTLDKRLRAWGFVPVHEALRRSE